VDVEADLKVKVSKYMSSLLRHNARGLKMDAEGSVDLDVLLAKLREHYPVDKKLILDIIERSESRRFELKENRIRALYGHTIPGLKRMERSNRYITGQRVKLQQRS
jgi:putative RNA 2'-phosphotransferase